MNIPVFLIFISGNEMEDSAGGLSEIVGSMTLGNIGESGPTCTMVDLGLNEFDVNFNCKSGKLKRIESIGMTMNNG